MTGRRLIFDDLKKEALKNPDVKDAYDESAPAYAVERGRIAKRRSRDLKRIV